MAERPSTAYRYKPGIGGGLMQLGLMAKEAEEQFRMLWPRRAAAPGGELLENGGGAGGRRASRNHSCCRRNGTASPDMSRRRRRMAETLMGAGMDTSPVQHWTQGAARMAQALVAGYGMRKADAAEFEGRSGAQQKLIQALLSPDGMDPAALAGMASDPWVDQGDRRP